MTLDISDYPEEAGLSGRQMQPYRERQDGWTAARTRKFLHALAKTGCVRDACAKAGISSTSAYRHRQRDPEFERAWEQALTDARPVLEAAAFERAVEGVDEPIVSGGKIVAYRKRYSDALLLMLLKRADQAAVVMRGMSQREHADKVLEELKARLNHIHKRMKEEEEAEALRQAASTVRQAHGSGLSTQDEDALRQGPSSSSGQAQGSGQAQDRLLGSGLPQSTVKGRSPDS